MTESLNSAQMPPLLVRLQDDAKLFGEHQSSPASLKAIDC
jgi:hypothetical protein